VSHGINTQITANVFDMVKMVMRAYKYRFYPTPGQAAESCLTFGCVRKVWNLAWKPARRRGTSGANASPTVSPPRC
jgi:hypothetical protein